MEEQGGLNLYGFVGNNGVNRLDPLGLFTIEIEDLGKDESDDLAPGTFMDAYPGRKSFIPALSLATTADLWSIFVTCKCVSRSAYFFFSKEVWVLDKANFFYHKKVSYKKKYNSPAQREWVQRAEQDHVDDASNHLQINAKKDVETEMPTPLPGYKSEQKCIDEMYKKLDEAMYKTMSKASEQSILKHDKSGKHTWRGPNQRK